MKPWQVGSLPESTVVLNEELTLNSELFPNLDQIGNMCVVCPDIAILVFDLY